MFLPPGAGRFVFGIKPSDEAKEKLFSDAISADINRESPTRKFIGSLLRAIARGPIPADQETRDAKEKAILKALPLDLATREVKLEQEQAQLDRELRILPFIDELKSARVNLDRSLAEKRRGETAVLLDLAASAREKQLSAARFRDAQAAALEQKTSLVATALGGLDAFSKMIFLRDRLFPPVVEPRRVGRPGRRRRVITAF